MNIEILFNFFFSLQLFRAGYWFTALGEMGSALCVYLSFEAPSFRKEIANSELEFHEILGQGYFGEVCLGVYRGDLCAIKKLKTGGGVADFEKEIKLSKSIPPHGNVVLFLGACYQPLMIVT